MTVVPPVQSDDLKVRLSPQVRAAISEAARRRGMTASGWLRQAAVTHLALEGVTLAPRDASTLYDCVEGRQRWARIKNGEIVGLYYHETKPEQEGYTWVPVVHEDSEPFDIARHWRLNPHYTLVDVYGTPDRVICTYPVVLKSLEHA